MISTVLSTETVTGRIYGRLLAAERVGTKTKRSHQVKKATKCRGVYVGFQDLFCFFLVGQNVTANSSSWGLYY